jgi:GTP-binding protein EngB required for normal cell division
LPVGVNPITAVPTRIVHGPEAVIRVKYLDRQEETLEVSKLPDLVSEEFNPGNSKHATRIVVEIPSRHLETGVVFVDTPGLGSLATSGAAETLAYLPQCDLGVVLVDAGSTLGAEDISTVRRLNEAAIPAQVLLSKADLLTAEERLRSIDYISSQMANHLGLNVPVFAVSTRGEDLLLLRRWFEREIQPLCARHREMSRRSLVRKVGALREAVMAALKVRLDSFGDGPGRRREQLESAESRLRRAAGRFEEVNAWNLRASDEIRSLGGIGLARAAHRIAHDWSSHETPEVDPKRRVADSLDGIASEAARQIADKLQEFAHELSYALGCAAGVLEVAVAPVEEDLSSVAREMPRWDFGTLEVALRPGAFAFLGERFLRNQIGKELRRQIGQEVRNSFERYSRITKYWTERALSELRRRFDAHADGYRSQIERLTNLARAGPEESEGLRHDLEALSDEHPEEPISTHGPADEGRKGS